MTTGGRRVEPGEYVVRVDKVEHTLSRNDQPMLAWELIVQGGDFDGSKLYHNTSLQPQALFNLRATLEALDFEVPDGDMEIDLRSLVGLTMGVEVDLEEYQGKQRSRVVEVFSLSEMDEEEADEEDDEEGGYEEEGYEDDEPEEVDEEDEGEDEEEDEEEEEEATPRARRRSRKAKR